MATSVEPIRPLLAAAEQIEDAAPLVSVIIPAYNEAAGIGGVLKALCDELELDEFEIIVVDDGSTDETPAVVRRFSRVRLIQNRVNKGYGSAIRVGTRAARGRHVVWFDADTQHRVEDLLAISRELTEKDLDYCIGVRDAQSHFEVRRWFGKWILKHVVRFAAGQPVRDFNSGLRGFRREVLERYLHLLPRGFGASTTTTLLMLERGYVGEELPISVRARVGKSSVRQFRDGFGTLLLILRIFMLFKPLHFFGSMAFVSILAGSIYGLREALLYSLGFPTLGSVVILFGVQMLVLGLLCDQISAMRRERFE